MIVERIHETPCLFSRLTVAVHGLSFGDAAGSPHYAAQRLARVPESITI